MFVVGEDQKRPPKGRTKAETAFKRINNCVLLVQLATYLTVVTLCTIAAGKTFESAFWTLGAELQLDTSMDVKTLNCTLPVTVQFGGWNEYPQVVSRDDFLWRVAYFSGSCRIALILCGVALMLGAFNKVLMETNIMEIKVNAFIFRKEILTTLEILLLVVGIWYISSVENDAEILRDYVKSCGLENQTSLFFVPPFVALYIGLTWTLFIHVCSFVCLCYSVCSKPPPVDTTRDHFLRKLSVHVKQHAQVIEQTNPYPENANFQSAVDFANMPVPLSPEELGPVMGAYPHPNVGLNSPGPTSPTTTHNNNHNMMMMPTDPTMNRAGMGQQQQQQSHHHY